MKGKKDDFDRKMIKKLGEETKMTTYIRSEAYQKVEKRNSIK